jgi:hypothetical protein
MLPKPIQDGIHQFNLHGKTSLIGSNSVRGILFGSDYDVVDFIHGTPKEIEALIHEEFIPSNVLVLEFKIQKGKDKHRFNLKTIQQPLAHLIRTCDFMKADLVIPIADRFAEVSVHYYRTPLKPQTSSLMDDVKEYSKTDALKALKRLYSIYNIQGKDTKELVDFFNSEIGLINKCINDFTILTSIKHRITSKAFKANRDYIRGVLATTTAPLTYNIYTLKEIVNKASHKLLQKYMN